jgi:hypothetical protein
MVHPLTAKQLSSYCNINNDYMTIETLTPKEESISIEEILTPEIRTQLQKDLVILSDEEFEENANSLKTIWKEKLPGLDHFIEAIFTLPVVFKNELKLKSLKDDKEESSQLTPKEKNKLETKLTENQAQLLGVLSEYLIKNKEDVKELEIFWRIYDRYSSSMKVYDLFEGFHAGITGQVCTYYLITGLGLTCALANSEEDAFQGTDCFISNSGRAPDIGRVQVKHWHEFERVEILDVKVYDPAFAVNTKVNIDGKEYKTHVSRMQKSLENLKCNCSPDELAFCLELPDQNSDGSLAIDNITGIPSEALVADFKTESEIVFKGKFSLA